jgi:hypothetical protein
LAAQSNTRPRRRTSVTTARQDPPRKESLLSKFLGRGNRRVRTGGNSAPPIRASSVPLVPRDNSRASVIAAAEQIAGVPVRELLMKFEPLGCDCELGFVQRVCEFEPLSMMRFSYMPLHDMIHGIQTNFIGLAEEIDAKVSQDGGWDLVQPAYQLMSHTSRAASEIDKATLLEQQRRRMAYLRDALLEDLIEAEKTFVVWRPASLTEEDVTPLWEAMKAHGPGRLLWVVKDEPAGVVQEVKPGLMRGTIDRWRDVSRDPHERISLPGWLALLANAWLLCREPQPEQVHPQLGIRR